MSGVKLAWHHVGQRDSFESTETSYCKTRSAAMLVLCKQSVPLRVLQAPKSANPSGERRLSAKPRLPLKWCPLTMPLKGDLLGCFGGFRLGPFCR